MDSFPTQAIPTQEISIKTPIAPSPTQQTSPNKKNFRKIFNITSWIVFFALLPVTVLIFLSQDSIPGDLFYPVKRSLENVVLAAASVSPATRAAFRTDLTETRFKEAQSLVLVRSNANGLSSFIDEVQGAKLEVTNLTSDVERNKAEEKLISKIEEYQSGLSTLQAKTEQNVITYQFQETPTSTPPPAGGPSTPTVTPSPTPRVITSQPSPQPSSTPISTLTIAPTIVANIQTTPQESVQVLEQKKIAQTLKETKDQLDKIKKDLEEKRSEEKKRHEERNESEKKDKEDKENREKIDSSDGHK